MTRFGTMSFADVLAPAIAYARDGFPVSEIIQRQWAASEATLAAWPTSAATYLPNGRPPEVGEVFRNPGLMRTYEVIAQGGRDAFYRGEIARKIVAFSESNGGYFTMRDFEDHSSVLGRAGHVELSRVRHLGDPAQQLRHRRPHDAEHPRGLRPGRDGAQLGRGDPPHRRSEEAGVRRPQSLRGRCRCQPPADRGADLQGVRRAAPGAHRSDPGLADRERR